MGLENSSRKQLIFVEEGVNNIDQTRGSFLGSLQPAACNYLFHPCNFLLSFIASLFHIETGCCFSLFIFLIFWPLHHLFIPTLISTPSLSQYQLCFPIFSNYLATFVIHCSLYCLGFPSTTSDKGDLTVFSLYHECGGGEGGREKRD